MQSNSSSSKPTSFAIHIEWALRAPDREDMLCERHAEYMLVSVGHMVVGAQMFISSTNTSTGNETNRNETELMCTRV